MTAPITTRPDPRSGGASWVLAGLVVRRWAVALGTSLTGLLIGGLVILVMVASAGLVFAARWEAPTARAPTASAESVLLAIVVSVWALAAAFGIFATHASAPSPALGFLRTLPVTTAEIRRATRLPLAVLIVGGVGAVGPTVLAVTEWATGRGVVHATALLTAVLLAGGALGAILYRLAAVVSTGPGLASFRLTGGYLGWVVVVAISVIAPLPLLQWTGDTAGLLLLAPLGWVAAWWALVDPVPLAVAATAASTAALLWIAARVGAAPSAAPRRAALRPLIVGRACLLVRVEARRLVRNPRTLEAHVVAAFFALTLALGAGWLSRRMPGTVSPTVIALLGAQVSASPAALARGLSARRRPVEAGLGVTPGTHVSALLGGSLVLVGVGALPTLVAALALLPVAVGVTWFAALPLLVALALLVSFALPPELGNGSAEGGVVLAFAALSTAVLAFVDRLPATGIPLLVAAVVAAVTLERAHRRPT